uniref:RING-type E3 ubiquitin transferase n=1 Tax=Aegilops tauschii subsp. strangulata TaxID=200361 RepID=A0A453I6N4_AEGTS
MAEEPGATSRYYCHMCSVIVRPELGVEEVKCPHCRSGFVEEMADGRRSSNAVGDRGPATGAGPDDAGARSELAVPQWPPILMDLLGVSYGLDGGDLATLARRQYRHLAFLQLLNALQEGDADADGDAPDPGLERLVLVSPADAHGGRPDAWRVDSWPRAGLAAGVPGRDRPEPARHAAGEDGGRCRIANGKGKRGRDLPGVPGRLRGWRRGQGDAVQAPLPRRVPAAVAGGEQLLPRLQVPAAHGRGHGAGRQWRRGNRRRIQWQCTPRRRGR